MVGFDPATYSTAEGGTVNVRIVLSQAFVELVTVQLRTMDDTATG